MIVIYQTKLIVNFKLELTYHTYIAIHNVTKRCVTNMSEHKLSDNQNKLLIMGLNYGRRIRNSTRVRDMELTARLKRQASGRSCRGLKVIEGPKTESTRTRKKSVEVAKREAHYYTPY